MVVHALLHGQPFCGFSTEVPALWPEDHRWTEVSDIHNINCGGCRTEAEKMLNERRSTTAIGEKGIAQVGETPDSEDGGILRI